MSLLFYRATSTSYYTDQKCFCETAKKAGKGLVDQLVVRFGPVGVINHLAFANRWTLVPH